MPGEVLLILVPVKLKLIVRKEISHDTSGKAGGL